MITPRTRLMLYLRIVPDLETLRRALADALAVPFEDVRGLDEPYDPAVRVETSVSAAGMRLQVDLYIDPLRATVPEIARLAVRLACLLGFDTAHHDGSQDPYAYVLVRPDGERILAWEVPDEDDGLVLDEENARALPRLGPP